jgi:hypothetical protein
MKKMAYTTIPIQTETKQKLELIKGKDPKESWDKLITRLIPKNETPPVEATTQ